MTGTVSGLFSRVAEKVDQSLSWWRLPKPLGILVLIGLRDRLRANNLYDTGRGPLDRPRDHEPPADDRPTARTLNGTYNDPCDPLMGSVGSRFGRNVPLKYTVPEEHDRLLDPNPRLISQRLLTRDSFQPATTLNLLAAAWIQFEVHDWFSHGTFDKDNDKDPWQIQLEPDDPWFQRPMNIDRTKPDPSPADPPTHVTEDTHWWDSSQIYGRTRDYADGLRTWEKGKLQIDPLGLPPKELDQYLDRRFGPAANNWVGLAILNSLFTREHNMICERLAAEHPQMSDQELYDKARLVNAALMAKIHTVEWTPAIIAHPTTVYAMHANWFGVLGERFRRRFGRITNSVFLEGIPGSPTDFHNVPYSLTEEFVAVYRMHPLIPDSVVFRSLADNHVIHEYDLSELTLTHIRPRLRGPEIKLPMADIFYSFGRSHPGAISLHNFPRYLQEFKRGDTEAPIDLATVDILRIREQGVPRYNEFRRLLRLKPASSFEELTDNPAWAEELRQVYGDVERVDLMIGLYAEPKPPGFGFSDTAFRIFILMATRRLQSDRFFTRDFRAEVYTQAGMDWVNTNTMRTVLLRHFPSLEPALDGVQNPFAPWAQVSGNQTPIPYSKDLERISPDEDKLIGRIVKVLHWNNNYEFRKNKHAIRDAHAKSHGILRGELTVHDDLPKELRQGLFANPGKTYSVIARLSSTSGAIRSDQLRGVRGLGIKVLGVDGEREATGLPGEPTTNQDFVLVTHREFPFAGARDYCWKGMPLAWLLTLLPDWLLGLVSNVASAAQQVGLRLPAALALFTLPNNHILGETFYSSAPLRYGDHVAKICYAPLSESVKALEGVPVPRAAGYDAHRDMVVQFFESNSAEYELRVQLCTDPETMPIEDARVEWPATASAYRGVATIRFDHHDNQNPDSPGRRDYGDEVLSFNSWRTLKDHRPLGSINRLKKQVYEASSNFRHEKNHVPRIEPKDIADLPN